MENSAKADAYLKNKFPELERLTEYTAEHQGDLSDLGYVDAEKLVEGAIRGYWELCHERAMRISADNQLLAALGNASTLAKKA